MIYNKKNIVKLSYLKYEVELIHCIMANRSFGVVSWACWTAGLQRLPLEYLYFYNLQKWFDFWSLWQEVKTEKKKKCRYLKVSMTGERFHIITWTKKLCWRLFFVEDVQAVFELMLSAAVKLLAVWLYWFKSEPRCFSSHQHLRECSMDLEPDGLDCNAESFEWILSTLANQVSTSSSLL